MDASSLSFDLSFFCVLAKEQATHKSNTSRFIVYTCASNPVEPTPRECAESTNCWIAYLVSVLHLCPPLSSLINSLIRIHRSIQTLKLILILRNSVANVGRYFGARSKAPSKRASIDLERSHTGRSIRFATNRSQHLSVSRSIETDLVPSTRQHFSFHSDRIALLLICLNFFSLLVLLIFFTKE